MIKKIFITTSFLIIALSALSQIPPGYYESAQGLSGDALKSALNDIIDDHNELSYDDVWNALRDTDEDPNNSNNVILLYTGWSVTNAGYPTWNREHTWAKSHGDFGDTAPCGTDIHHLRPTDCDVNSARGNLDFDYSDYPYPNIPSCYYDDDSWEPRDDVKGDVARMIFYMATRYEGENGELDLVVVDEVNTSPAPEHGKLSTLLAWNTLDLPDEFEETRNDKIFENWQGNRNPFVDHPEFADYIWGGAQPDIIADFYADLTLGNPPLEVQFTDNSSGEDIIAWSWDLDGDGSIDSNLQNPSFTYNEQGIYDVSLSIEDINGNTDTEIKIGYIEVTDDIIPVEIYSESFEDVLTNWTLMSLSSNNDWHRSDNISDFTHPSNVPSGDWYVYVNNYNSNDAANDWLISPAIDLTQFDDPYFHFDAWTKFEDSIVGLEILVTSDFTGNPVSTNWTIASAALPPQDSGIWQDSGNIDLTDFTNDDQIQIAFHYTSTGTGASSTTAWAIDDLNILGTEQSQTQDEHFTQNYNLHNYPNPLSLSSMRSSSYTTIEFSIPQDSFVKLTIYNTRGQLVKQLINENLSKGKQTTVWNGKNNNSQTVSTGIYIYQLDVSNHAKSYNKMLITK